MATAMRGYLLRRPVPWAVLILALVTATGCAGGSPVATDQAGPVAQVAADLPRPGQITHSAAALETPASALGSSFRTDLLNQHVAVDGSTAVFTPQDAADQQPAASDFGLSRAAIAVYSFDVTDLAGEPQLALSLLSQMLPEGSSQRVFAGIANRRTDSWDWQELSYEPDSAEGPRLSGHSQGGTTGPWLDLALVVYGDAPLTIDAVSVRPSDLPDGTVQVFRKGWDGTVKGSPGERFGASISISPDGRGRPHVAYYDSSAGQLYHMWLADRVWFTQALTSEDDAGSSNDLVATPDGGLLAVYYDATRGVGPLRWLAPESLTSLVWSPQSNYDEGSDELGTPIDAGARCQAVFDVDGNANVFYEDRTTGRIRHAWQAPGVMGWLHEYVSPPDVVASSPRAYRCADSACATYQTAGKLWIAEPGNDGWELSELADDLANPLDPAAEFSFCDGAVRERDQTAVFAMACTGGLRVIHRDLAARNVLLSELITTTPGDGAFVDVALLADDGVCLTHFNPKEYKVFFETGDIPSAEQFTRIVALAFDGPDEDCDGLACWVSPDLNADGTHDVLLVTMSTKDKPKQETKPKRYFTGHVTLLKQ
ncbi:hypothetical protein JW859_04490 [bacterium]|nr:hypothetical protein [bacterium]